MSVDYFDESSPSGNFKSHQRTIEKFNKITKRYANRNGEPNTSVSEIFEKTAQEAASFDVSISQVAKEESGVTGTGNSESTELLNNIYSMASTQFIQMFYDLYMSPLNSDIEYRLGKVTGTKTNFQNIGKFKSESAFNGAQFDKYGRIDTTTNFRMTTHIDGFEDGSIREYDEYFVNWFFPPYNQAAFKTSASISEMASRDITQRVWNNSHQCWEINGEKDETTYDIRNMMSCRPNPTYRMTAFKSVNDNIQWLQHIYEYCTGIVSTYLTEWDLSLYIQEGLLEDAKKYPVINMCYRILDDNPMGWHDTRAFSFGTLNAALSKTPTCGIIPNTLDWKPNDYPLSTYWTELDSADRGDGLDIFYDVAIAGHNSTNLTSFGYGKNTFNELSLKEKVKFYDDVGAAYSGWTSYQGMKMYQILFTSPDDGFNCVDLAHLTEPVRMNKTNGLTLKSAIESVIEADYEMDDSLGYEYEEEKIIEDAYPKKLLGLRNRWVYRKKNWITGEYEECGAKITPRWNKNITLGWQKPVKGLIFTPKWVPSIHWWGLPKKPFSGKAKNALDIGPVNSLYGPVDPESVETGNGTIGNNPALERTKNGFYKVPDVSASSFADHFGIPQKSPALYGGPHGKYLSPKTTQAYFEEDNIFLKNVPRVDKKFETSLDYTEHFTGNNGYYSYVCGEDTKINPSRSPSYSLALLNKGLGDKTKFFSNISAFWEINKVEVKSTTLTKKKSRFNYFLRNIISYFSPWVSRYSVAVESRDVYRLQILSGKVSKTVNVTRQNGTFSATSQLISQEEKDFVNEIFGIKNYGENSNIKSEWKNVFFFQNNSKSERFEVGPNVIFQVPVRVNSYRYTKALSSPLSWIHILFGWTGLFGWWAPQLVSAYSNYLEVDCDHVYANHNEKFWPIWTAMNLSTNAYSNIGTDSDPTIDVPSDSHRTLIASSPWVFEEQAATSTYAFVQSFLGHSKNLAEMSIFGWGYTTAFQCMEASDDKYKVSGVGGLSAEDTPIKDLHFKFWKKDGKFDYADTALNKTLQNLYTTATFYKYSPNQALYSMPCIIQSDVPLRVAVKAALHQVAWLKQAKESFIENIDFAEVNNIIESMVEPSIKSASVSNSREDLHFNYWIKKASEFFKQDKSVWANKFNVLISAYNGFISEFKGLVGKSALSWTYNNFKNSFTYLEKMGTTDSEVGEFMTAYLTVLYEYRKYFLNRRFNKAGGTMTSMKYLESTIPLMIDTKKTPSTESLNSVDTLPANFGAQEYEVSMFGVTNSNTEKLAAAAGQIAPLKKDKIKVLYIKVDYANNDEVNDYIDKLRNNVKIPDNEQLMYIAKNDKWAKLPLDGVYQLVGKEWENNQKNKVWNLTCNPGAERPTNSEITDCIFNIIWCLKQDTPAYKTLRSVDTSLISERDKNTYIIPYSYQELENDDVPFIKFGVTNGIDLNKISDVTSNLQMSDASPMDIICTTRDVDDYWEVKIPFSEMPLLAGYKTKLKIKTYIENPAISVAQETIAGPMTFTVWPITEDQVDVTPGIGVNMTEQAEQLRRTRTSIDVGAK